MIPFLAHVRDGTLGWSGKRGLGVTTSPEVTGTQMCTTSDGAWNYQQELQVSWNGVQQDSLAEDWLAPLLLWLHHVPE
jgi:hypothetical protein